MGCPRLETHTLTHFPHAHHAHTITTRYEFIIEMDNPTGFHFENDRNVMTVEGVIWWKRMATF